MKIIQSFLAFCLLGVTLILVRYLLVFSLKYLKKLDKNNSQITLSVKGEKFETEKRFWLFTLPGIYFSCAFLFLLTCAFSLCFLSRKTSDMSDILFVIISILGLYLLFVGLVSVYSIVHKNDYFYISFDKIEYRLGTKQNTILSNDIKSITSVGKDSVTLPGLFVRRLFVIHLKDGQQLQIKKEHLNGLIGNDRLTNMIGQLSEAISKDEILEEGLKE